MKMKALTVLFLSVSTSFGADLFCKGNACSEFDKYVAQIKESYLKMQALNQSCGKNDGKSCLEVGLLVRDSELTIRPQFKEDNKKLLGKLGLNPDYKSYLTKACSLKIEQACQEAAK